MILFIIQTIGWIEFLKDSTKVTKEYLPCIVVALQSILLIAAGMINMLPTMVVILVVLGCAYLVFKIFKTKGMNFFKDYCSLSYLFLVVVMISSAVILKDELFAHYDNYSHWAIIVKFLLGYERLPIATDNIISFKTYSLGTSIFIYFFTKLVSHGAELKDYIQMLAQVYMMAVCIMPLFSIKKSGKVYNWLQFVIVLLFTYVFFSYNVGISNLQVDTVLALQVAAALLFVLTNCEDSKKAGEYFALAILLAEIVQVKNSGILFAAIFAAIAFFRNFSFKTIKSRLFLSIPFIGFIAWFLHCKISFVDLTQSKHSISLQSFKNIFAQKSGEDISVITGKLFEYILNSYDFFLLLVALIALGVVAHRLGEKSFAFWKRSFVIAIVLYVVYQIGLLGMFIFSMPKAEALLFASGIRYERTLNMCFLYIVLAITLSMLARLEKKKFVSLAICLAAYSAAFILVANVSDLNFRTSTYTSDTRARIEAIKEDLGDSFEIADNEYIMVITDKYDADYSLYIAKYVFDHGNAFTMPANDVSSLKDIDFEYILLCCDNEKIDSIIKENFPEQFGNSLIVNTR